MVRAYETSEEAVPPRLPLPPAAALPSKKNNNKTLYKRPVQKKPAQPCVKIQEVGGTVFLARLAPPAVYISNKYGRLFY